MPTQSFTPKQNEPFCSKTSTNNPKSNLRILDLKKTNILKTPKHTEEHRSESISVKLQSKTRQKQIIQRHNTHFRCYCKQQSKISEQIRQSKEINRKKKGRKGNLGQRIPCGSESLVEREGVES